TAVSALGAGRHEVRVSASGHGAVEQSLVLDRGGRAAVEVALPDVQRELALESVPSGARVFIDGQPQKGRTPMSVSVTQDDFHELRFELDGYESELRALKPEDRDGTVTVHLAPAKLDRATVWIEGPLGAEVWLDSAPLGVTTPTGGLQLPTGSHWIELRRTDGVVIAGKAIRVARGEIVHVTPQAR
ncbi:MAG TPA: PEGA domain-containing protein, partial [Polyangia bacterium]